MEELPDTNDYRQDDEQYEITTRNYKRVACDSMLNILIEGKADFRLRRGSECHELIFDGNHNIYTTKSKNFPPELIFLFNNVRRNVQKYLDNNPPIVLPPKKEVSFYNYDYNHNKGVKTGTDLNHAYWRIAYTKNYITKRTYEQGLPEKAKAIRLASLSILGRHKIFDEYKQGVFVEKVVTQKKNEALNMVFHDIRYTCFYMMYELSVMLGEDFDCWKTDCIYYRDTPENRKMVQDYFDEREMLWKQLVYANDDNTKDVDY